MPDETKSTNAEQAEQLQDLPAAPSVEEADAVKGGGVIVEERSLATSSVPLTDVSIRMGAQPHL